MEKVYKNSHYLFIAVLLMALVGFWKTYFGLVPAFTGVSSLMHFHALMVLAWLGILIAQPILIRAKNLEMHRLVGRVSYVVVPLLLLSIVLLMRLSIMKNTLPQAPTIDLRLVGIADLTFFIPCYLLAIYYRKKTAYHARFMVLTVLPFINPALGRLSLPGPLLAIAIMVGLLIYEAFNRKIFRPYLIALPAYLGIYIFYLYIINAEDWKRFWWMFF